MIGLLNNLNELAAILENDGSAAASYWDDEVHEKLNDAYITLKFTMRGDHEAARHAIIGNKAVLTDLDNDIQVFEIKTVDDYQDENGIHEKQVYAEHIALELNGKIVRPGNYNGYTAEQFLDIVLANTRWKAGKVEWFGIRNFSIDEHKSGIDAIITAANEFEGEFKFRIEMQDGQIKDLYIDLLERRGSETGIQIEKGHNQKSLKRIEDSSEVYTALIGIAKGSEGYLTFADIEAEDKPRGQDWIGNDEALQTYGILMPNGERQHYMGVYIYGGANEDLTPEQLLTYTRRQLTRVSKPKFTYEAYAYDLEDVSGFSQEKMRLGDTISINNTDFEPNILLDARIVEYIWSKSDKSRNRTILGDYRELWADNLYSQIASLRNTIISNAGSWEAGGTEIIRSAVAPTDTNVIWIDTSQTPNIVKSFNPDTGLWEKATPTTAAEVDADPTGTAEAAKQAAIDAANAETALAEARANAYADGIVSEEEARAIADATAKANAARDAAISAAESDATAKAAAAEQAAIDAANAETQLAETRAKSYADGIVTTEEQARIAQDEATLNAAKADAQTKANAAKQAAIDAAALDAQSKANAAKQAAIDAANAETALAETRSKAYADGIVDDEEAARIAQAEANLKAAQADATSKANAAEEAAKAHAELIASKEASEKTFSDFHKEFYNFFAIANKNSTLSGALYIYTNIKMTNRMYNLDFKGFNYAEDQAVIDFSVSFYAYGTTNTFSRKSFVNRGSKIISSVKAALDPNGKVVLIITPETGGWSYPALSIDRMSVSYQAADADVEKGWTGQFLSTQPIDLTVITDFPAMISESVEGAQAKANEAQAAAEEAAAAEASAAEVRAKAYADGEIDKEEARAIADAQAKADAAKSAAISAAAADAQTKADAAKQAAIDAAYAETQLAETRAKAYADGVVDAEEAARIKQAEDNLAAAKADATSKANSAQTAAEDFTELYAQENVYKQSAAPAHKLGRLWLDTSKNPNVLYRSTGSSWVKASPTAAAEIGAETPTGAQSKADTAKNSAINTAAADATNKANTAESNAKAAISTTPIPADNISGLVAAGKIDIDLQIQGAVPPYQPHVDIFSEQGFTYLASDFYNWKTHDLLYFKKSKRYLRVHLVGKVARYGSESGAAGYIDARVIDGAQNEVAYGTVSSWTDKSIILDVDMGAPTGAYVYYYVQFKARKTSGVGDLMPFLRNNIRYLYDL